jgi:hypothetical protein
MKIGLKDMVINMIYRQDEICVCCGRYIGESSDMICDYCKKENFSEKRLDKPTSLWYNIITKLKKYLRKK